MNSKQIKRDLRNPKLLPVSEELKCYKRAFMNLPEEDQDIIAGCIENVQLHVNADRMNGIGLAGGSELFGKLGQWMVENNYPQEAE